MTDSVSDDVKSKYMDIIPLKRAGQKDDVANACLFLASDMSSYITGQTLCVCGGMVMP
jgi:3-oxoacyl-[acyl-carrier protein] reductase